MPPTRQPRSQEVRHHRANVATLTYRKGKDDPETIQAKAALEEAVAADKLAEYVDRVLAEAPSLTNEQRIKLAGLLEPVRVRPGRSGDERRQAVANALDNNTKQKAEAPSDPPREQAPKMPRPVPRPKGVRR